MSNLLEATITLQGLRPLLWHHFGPHALPLTKQEKTGVAGNDPEEWKRTVLYLPDTRQLYLEPMAFFSCLREAARYTRRGRGSLQTSVAATLHINNTYILINRTLPPEPLPTEPDEPVYLYIASVRNPTTRARNIRYRVAAAPGWQAIVSIQWDRTLVSRQEMESILHDAGRLVGLGDGRGIGFGRFVIDSADIHETTTETRGTAGQGTASADAARSA